MRLPLPSVIEPGRIRNGSYASPPRATHGCFRLTCPATGAGLLVVFSSGVDWAECGLPGQPWEHASVSVPGKKRCPTWEEMCWIKDLFWAADEAVMQLHPPAGDYINQHEFCLHLWRPIGAAIPLPPPASVGFKRKE